MQHSRAHLLISGRVQGVFYRAFAQNVAGYLGLKGWVRNLPDGNVEVLIEGNRNDIEQAIQRFRSGPPGARVDDIDITWEDYQGDIQGFQIRYY
jgi:acylphosphatase